MAACKICLKEFQHLRYRSSRVCICGRCTNDLNSYEQVAEFAYLEARQMLERGILRKAELDLMSAKPKCIQDKALAILENPTAGLEQALPAWINRLVSDKSSRTKIFKMIRAERRGLLRRRKSNRWDYPSNWPEVARRIRRMDEFTCVACRATAVELHVHHIVYVSHFGTHQQTSLVTLCRSCHELEHKRSFDFGENMANTYLVPTIEENSK